MIACYLFSREMTTAEKVIGEEWCETAIPRLVETEEYKEKEILESWTEVEFENKIKEIAREFLNIRIVKLEEEEE